MKIFRDNDTFSLSKLSKHPKFFKFKYSYLAIVVVAQLVLPPLLQKKLPLIISLLFLALMLAVLGTLGLRKSLLRFLFGLGFLAFLFSAIARTTQLPYQGYRSLYVAGLSASALFLLIAITVLVMKIFSEKVITAETLKGGIAVYFLMGFLWASLYSLLILLNPQSISFPPGSVEYSEITYFSFTTLTTLGYGDVTPVSWLARNFTILESTFGQIYLTVLIARLVGLHIAGSMRSSSDQ